MSEKKKAEKIVIGEDKPLSEAAKDAKLEVTPKKETDPDKIKAKQDKADHNRKGSIEAKVEKAKAVIAKVDNAVPKKEDAPAQ